MQRDNLDGSWYTQLIKDATSIIMHSSICECWRNFLLEKLRLNMIKHKIHIKYSITHEHMIPEQTLEEQTCVDWSELQVFRTGRGPGIGLRG